MTLTNSMIGWGIRFDAATYDLQVTANFITDILTFPATGSLSLTQDYYMTGDGEADDLVTMLAACIESHAEIGTVTGDFVSWTLRMTGNVSFTLEWADANTTLDQSIFGWPDSDTSSASIQTATDLPHGIWRPQRPIAFDSRDRQPIVGGMASSLSGESRVSRFADPLKTRDVNWIYLPQDRVLTEYTAADEPSGAFEYGWLNSISLGRILRLYEDEDTRTSSSYSSYRIADLSDPMVRNEQYPTFWDVNLRLRRSA